MPSCVPNWLNGMRRRTINRMETSVVVADGLHNAFTDLIAWRGSLWLVYVASPSHFASPKSRLVLLRSSDAREWQELARLGGSGEDIRDPKLAVIHDRLTLFALLNRSFDPLPYKTVRADSGDGRDWSPLVEAGPEGWLFGKPKTADEKTWYVPAHHLQKSSVALLRSSDGLHWEMLSAFCLGEKADETAIEFLSGGSLLAATRLEAGGGLFGSPRAGSMLSVSTPPYTNWTEGTHSAVTRLDGPALFPALGSCYAVGRFQPRLADPFGRQGSIFSRKRTSLFKADASGLTWLANLPSAGDTAYAGIASWNGGWAISYYTSDPRRDGSWILGMLRPTRIQITRISSSELSNITPQEGK